MITLVRRLAAGRGRSGSCFGVSALLALSLQLSSQDALATDALDQPINLNIPTNTRLEDALIEWATTSGLTVMMNTPTVSNHLTHGVHVTLSARDALVRLLRDSGLSYTEEGGRVHVVQVATLVRSADR